MLIGALVLLSSSLLNQRPLPVFAAVSIGGHGPYRFLVDTGAQTSLIDPKLAAELGLKPAFRVEIVTQHSSRLLPALRVGDLRIGAVALPDTELVLHDTTEARRLDKDIRGLLGLNALAGLSFTLTPQTGRLDLDAGCPVGEAIPIARVEGRVAILARMGADSLLLALDSGATHVVLFRTPAAMAKTHSIEAFFGTLEGARRAVPTTWTAEMIFGGRMRVGTLPAAIVERNGTELDGLLPASVFKTIYVDQRRGEAILAR